MRPTRVGQTFLLRSETSEGFHSDCHDKSHWNAGMGIVRYLNHTNDLGGYHVPKSEGAVFRVTAYADASFQWMVMTTLTLKTIFMNNKLVS